MLIAEQHDVRAQSQQAVDIVIRAEQAFKKGQYTQAIALCQKALKQSPRYVRAHSWQGAAHRRRFLVLKRDPKQKAAAERHRLAAIDSFRKVMLLKPHSPDARVAKAGIDELMRLAPFLTPLTRAKLMVDGQNVKLSTPLAITPAGRLMIPLRDFGQAIGCQVTYNAADNSISLQSEHTNVRLKVNYYQATIDDAEITLEQPPVIEDGKIFISADLSTLAFKASHRWRHATQTLTMRTDGTEEEVETEEGE